MELTDILGADKVKLSLMDIERLLEIVKSVVFLLFYKSFSFRKAHQEKTVKIGARKQ